MIMESQLPLVDLTGSRAVHMIGIGGAGMEPLARLLQHAGHDVRGSDQADGEVVQSLRTHGIDVWTGAHDSARVEGADIVVYSAAVTEDNPELRAARDQVGQVLSRAQLLGWFSRQRPMIAVAGTHGKTTTSSMIVAVARAAGQDPGVVVGGWQSGASLAATGQDDLLVAEADEYDRSFLSLHPMGAVVTNIEADHHDTYADDAALDDAFTSFLGQTSDWIVTHDEPRCVQVAARSKAPVTLCGGPRAHVQLQDVVVGTDHCQLQVKVGGEARPAVQLAARGQHNVDNAMTAIAVADRMGWPWSAVDDGLTGFRGVDRRLQTKAELHGTLVVDDYAHHPTEVAAALRWARGTDRRVVAVFQPHLYSRTQHLLDDFGDALSLADEVTVCEIYAAREAPIAGVTSSLLTDALRERGVVARDESHPTSAISTALDRCSEGDLLLVMGAGDVGDRLDDVLSLRRAEAS